MVTLHEQENTIQLHVVAPKKLLIAPMLIEAKLNSTWYEVLKEEFDLELTPEQGIFVCTKGYTYTAPKDGGGWKNGWRADLSEPVSQFVSKFKRKQNYYKVRLCDPSVQKKRLPGIFEHMELEKVVIPRGGQGGKSKPNVGRPIKNNKVGNPKVRPPKRGPSGGQRRSKANESVVVDYNKPRYVHAANGNRSQQQRYSTRLKRQLDGTSKADGGQHERITQNSTRVRRQRHVCHEIIQNQNSQNLTLNEPTIAAEIKLFGYWVEREEGDGAAAMGEGVQEIEVVDLTEEEDLEEDEMEHFQNDYVNVVDLEDEEEKESDMASLYTEASQEEEELRREGIQMENLKPLSMKRMKRFSNAYMLRVKNEIQKLRENHMWDKSVHRSPLACYLLQEVFN